MSYIKKKNRPNCSQFQLVVAAQSKALPNINSHVPPYNPQKYANHLEQSYHTKDRSTHIVHVVIVIGDESEHTLCKSSIINYELYEGHSPSRFYATLLDYGIIHYVATPSSLVYNQP